MSEADKAALEEMTDAAADHSLRRDRRHAPDGRAHGVTPAGRGQCLADPKGLEASARTCTRRADSGVKERRHSSINGKMTDAATWEKLEPLI